MRKTFTTIALFAVLGTLAVSCQKENIIDETNIVAENGTVYTVTRLGKLFSTECSLWPKKDTRSLSVTRKPPRVLFLLKRSLPTRQTTAKTL